VGFEVRARCKPCAGKIATMAAIDGVSLELQSAGTMWYMVVGELDGFCTVPGRVTRGDGIVTIEGRESSQREY